MAFLKTKPGITKDVLYERFTQLQTVYLMADAVSRAEDLAEVYRQALDGLERTLKIDRVAILMFDPDGVIRFQAWRGLSGAYRQKVEGHSPWPSAEIDPQPILISNVKNEQDLLGDLYPIISQEGIQAIGFIPLTHQSRLLGKFMIYYNQPHEFTREELWLVQTIASHIAFATDRKRVEIELNTYRERLEALVRKRTLELERSMAEATAARDRLDAILQSVGDGLIVTDLNHKVILANPAAETLLDFQLADVIGQEIGLGARNNKLRDIVQQTINKQHRDYEIDIVLDEPGPPAQRRILQARTTLVDDQRGHPLGTVTIIQDVTRLREVDRLKTELLTTATHELRTPLTSILGFSELLLTRNLDEERHHYFIQLINEQAAHLNKIIVDLLDISRLQTGKELDLTLEPVDMARLISENLVYYTELTDKHTLQTIGLEHIPLIQGDQFRLNQVLRNLLSNAVKYSPQGEVITVRAQVIPGCLKISVEDKGPGLTLAQQRHLFEPFYRADFSNTAVAGTGLGLAISKLIIQQHGGEIWLTSAAGEGTTVSFTLPLDNPLVEPK